MPLSKTLKDLYWTGTLPVHPIGRGLRQGSRGLQALMPAASMAADQILGSPAVSQALGAAGGAAGQGLGQIANVLSTQAVPAMTAAGTGMGAAAGEAAGKLAGLGLEGLGAALESTGVGIPAGILSQLAGAAAAAPGAGASLGGTIGGGLGTFAGIPVQLGAAAASPLLSGLGGSAGQLAGEIGSKAAVPMAKLGLRAAGDFASRGLGDLATVFGNYDENPAFTEATRQQTMAMSTPMVNPAEGYRTEKPDLSWMMSTPEDSPESIASEFKPWSPAPVTSVEPPKQQTPATYNPGGAAKPQAAGPSLKQHMKNMQGALSKAVGGQPDYAKDLAASTYQPAPKPDAMAAAGLRKYDPYGDVESEIAQNVARSEQVVSGLKPQDISSDLSAARLPESTTAFQESEYRNGQPKRERYRWSAGTYR